jgi:membrane protease YdiL (CAAX protease family)
LPGAAIALIGFAAMYCVVEILLHFRDDPAFTLNVCWIVLMLSPVLGFMAFKRAHVAAIKDYYVFYEDKGVKKILSGGEATAIMVLSCTLINLTINIIANLSRAFTFQIQPVEIYLFYAAISVAEEVTFRILIVTPITGLFSLSRSARNSRGPVIFAAIVSGLLFSAAHWNVYHAVPEMMYATCTSGFTMALFYGFTKNPLVPIVAHLVNNLIAALFVFAASILTVM